MTRWDGENGDTPEFVPLEDGSVVLFADCRLVNRNRSFFVDGEEIELGSRVLALLTALVEMRGRLVTGGALANHAWPGHSVGRTSLHLYMTRLRQAFGRERNFIETVPGQGYRFTADVTIIPRQHPTAVESGHGLPRPLSRLLGRDGELAELSQQLRRRRVITLIGPGGIGKTRLAMELGRRVAKNYLDGACVADLGPITDPTMVATAIATALGVMIGLTTDPAGVIGAAIADQHRLLILDNCEHLIDAARTLVTAILERVSGLSVLATSQQRLGISGEQLYRLKPLAVPARDLPGDGILARLATFGAIELFVERVSAADLGFELTPDNVGAVASICRQLDGVPLALEMAAARVPLLGLSGLLAGLDDRLRMLKHSARAGEARHRSLSTMIEWSYGLLDAPERRVFRSLAIFVGSFSLAAASAVAGDGITEIAPILQRLVDKSLLAVEDEGRYRLLESLRFYGLDRLRQADEQAAAAERHTRYFADLLDRADDSWESTADAVWVETYRCELDNIRAALDWALTDPARVQLAATIAGPFAIVWYNLGLILEGRSYTERILAALGPEATLPAARFLRFGSYLWDSSDRQRSLALLEAAAGLYRQLGAPLDLAPVLATLARLYLGSHRDAEADDALAEARRLLANSGRKKSMLGIVTTLATFAYRKHETGPAESHLTHALELAKELNDSVRVVNVLANIAEFQFSRGIVDRAITHAREALAIMRATGRRTHREWVLANLASYLIIRGETAEARIPAEEALNEARDSGGLIVRICLQIWTLIGALEGRIEAAARLLGFIDRGFERSGVERDPTEQRIHAELQQAFAGKASAPQFEDWAADGAEWSEERAVAFTYDRLIAREPGITHRLPGT